MANGTEKGDNIEARLAALPDDAAHVRERVDLLNELGWRVREQADWKRILAVAEQAQDLAQRHSYERGLTGAFRNAAFAHYMLASYKSALGEALVALRLAQEQDDPRNQANAYAVIALVHWSLGNYDEALEEVFRGLRIAEELNEPWVMGWGYTIAGGIYETIGDPRQARQYQEKALEIFSQHGERLGEARSLSGLGAVLQAMGETQAALDCHRKALRIYRAIGNCLGEARALNDLGAISHNQGNSERALSLHHAALRIRERQDSQQSQATSLLHIGRIHLDRGEDEEAGQALTRALRIAEAIGAKPKVYQAHELLSALRERTGDIQAALAHYKSFHRIKEQVFGEEANTKLKNLEIGIEVERSRRETEIHRLKNVELKEKNEQLAKLLEELQATQSQLVQTEKMAALGDLVGGIAHEINTPLGAIQTSADISIRGAERVVEAIELSQTIQELKSRRAFQATITALRKNGQIIASASERIGRLIRGLKSFARLDQAPFQKFTLEESLESALILLEPSFRDRIAIVKEYCETPPLYGYPAQLNQVFMNLLRNAEEAIPEKGTITVRTYGENGFACARISDTGRGIPEEHFARLFNPGFAVRGRRVRASMSLFASANIVQQHRGEIQVESKAGEGATFTVRLRGLDPNEESWKGAQL